MLKGIKLENTKINPVLRYQLNRHKFTTKEICKLFNLCKPTTLKLLYNPYNMTINQLLLLSGRLGLPYIELVYMLHLNKPKLSVSDKATLLDIVNKVEKEQL